MKWVIIALLLCSIAVAAEVRQGEVPLLALMDNGTSQSGSVAMLGLEIVPGSERVFLETFPMTKITTQASLRFAQQVACKELDIDCSGYDFLFTIEALPGIVGGPSAGSAAALLTSALLLNKSIPKDIAMTGTINSGGIVGIVGGVKEKIEAAAKTGVKKVFVPKGTKEVKFANKTFPISAYGAELNVSVIEVSTLGELIEGALGVPQRKMEGPLQINPVYQDVMRAVANDLCSRSKELGAGVKNISLAKNLTSRAVSAQAQGEWYAAASYCFRANVDLKQAQYREQKLSASAAQEKAKRVRLEGEALRKDVELRNITTITDLQTQMAVLERVDEALNANEEVERLNRSERLQDAVIGDLVYAEERLFSAITWARFFGNTNENIVVNVERIKQGCASKVSEAEERYNYVKSVIPEALDGTRNDIDKAYGLLEQKEYALCLHLASKAKAEADVLLAAMGVNDLDEAVDIKLRVARDALMRAQEKGVFPIIAYSYYEYANSLKDFDKVSSILFAGYALELANVDIYFEGKHAGKAVPLEEKESVQTATSAGVGFLIGAFVMFLLMWHTHDKGEPVSVPQKKRKRK